MKVAAVQLKATKNKSKNCEKAKAFIEEAAKRKAKWVLLPELFVYRGSIASKKHLSEIAEHIDGPTVKSFQQLAKERHVNILLGSIYEKRKTGSKVYNASVMINDQGKIAAVYRKKNLFHASIKDSTLREQDLFVAGQKTAIAKVGRWSAGMAICYDLRFPEMFRRYSQKKTEAVVVPSNFTQETGRAHWEVLLRARAVEGLCYVIAPNQVGRDDRGVQSYGNSMIVSPWGEVLARASGSKEEIIYANLDKKKIQRAKKILPGIIN